MESYPEWLKMYKNCDHGRQGLEMMSESGSESQHLMLKGGDESQNLVCFECKELKNRKVAEWIPVISSVVRYE